MFLPRRALRISPMRAMSNAIKDLSGAVLTSIRFGRNDSSMVRPSGIRVRRS